MQGEEFESMLLTRLQFKYALRYIKQHDNIMRKDSLAKKLAMTKFWSEIRMMSGKTILCLAVLRASVVRVGLLGNGGFTLKICLTVYRTLKEMTCHSMQSTMMIE